MMKQTKKGEGSLRQEDALPKAREVAPNRSLRDRLNEEQRRLEKIWRQDPTRLWKSR